VECCPFKGLLGELWEIALELDGLVLERRRQHEAQDCALLEDVEARGQRRRRLQRQLSHDRHGCV
jgi:hypothetical protein